MKLKKEFDKKFNINIKSIIENSINNIFKEIVNNNLEYLNTNNSFLCSEDPLDLNK